MRVLLVTLLLASPALTLAQTKSPAVSPGMESGWLELVKGHRDDKMGAEVRDVVIDPETGHQTIEVAIPKESVTDTMVMEEVVVTGKAPRKMEPVVLFPEMETEWIDDYDNDHYGLLVKLKKDQAMPFRLFFSAHGQGGTINNNPQP